ncbi:hypothetical protein BDW62DRAFT_13796 [Aspergillus aurantiobrunneus]
MYPVYREPRPIPASTASRSKLNAFRYKDNNENGTDITPMKTSPQKGQLNKENQTSWLNGVVERDESKLDGPQSQEVAEAKAVKDCPQTPGNRLPLADLIGNAEDAFSRAPVGQEFTPEDYVIWQHAPPSSNPSTQTPATQSKKRCHSSSPSSSPLAGSKGAHKGSFDLQAFQSLLKTPQNDLATDLWNNYVAKSTTNLPDLQQPRFANLLSSSPHTPGSATAAQDSSGLRRSISCNAEWPSSKAKRRKIEGENHPTGRAIFSRSRSNVMVPKDLESSNFSSLVKEMERSLKRAPPRQPDPSKIAPAIIQGKARCSRSASPLETKLNKPAVMETSLGDNTIDPPSASRSKKTPQRSSSDFGDDDLDDEFLGLAESTTDPFVEPTRKDSACSVSNTELRRALPSNGVQHSFDNQNYGSRPEADKASHKTGYTLDVDEFDDDFEGFSDNIDEILAGCDQTPSNKLPRAAQHPSTSECPRPRERTERPSGFRGELQTEKKEQFITSSSEFDDNDFDMDCFDEPIPQEAAKLSSVT